MAATRVCSSPYPFHCPSWTRSLRVTHELRGRQPQWLCSEFVPFLLLFDCQEAFHCCLVVTCINRINMISIQCHRVGEWWSGKPEFENVSDPAGVYIPFNILYLSLWRAIVEGHSCARRIVIARYRVSWYACSHDITPWVVSQHACVYFALVRKRRSYSVVDASVFKYHVCTVHLPSLWWCEKIYSFSVQP